VATVSTRIVTIPNLLSLFRLLLIPVFLVLLLNAQYLWALLVLVASSLTDFVDGYVARHFNQVTRVGQLLDPAADRLFIFSTLIGLAWTGFIPWWLAGVIFGRELLLLIVGVILANFGYGPLPVHHLGKMGTFALLTAMPLLVLGAAFPQIDAVANPVGWAAALWGVFLYWWAGILYALEAGRLIRIPRDAPAAASDSLDALRED
jgi:cardiolipin synthase